MVRVVTQETYNEIVKENIEDFSMTHEQAIQDAVQQLEAQGVDLSNIIKDLSISTSSDLKESIINLKELIKSPSISSENFNNELNTLKSICDKDLGHKILVANEGAYSVFIEILEKVKDDNVIVMTLKTITSLMTGQPDLLDEKGITLMINYVDTKHSVDIRHFTLRWMKETCTKHEMNRQNIFNTGVLNTLKQILNESNVTLIKDACLMFRTFVLDDDIRHEFGKAHEHARLIAIDTLDTLTSFLIKYKEEESLISDLMLTVAVLLVRNEFCQKFQEDGGLKSIIEVIEHYCGHGKIIRQALKLLTALAGNDDCKKQIIKQGAAPILTASIRKHNSDVNTLVIGLACVAALSLREPDNSQALFEAGIPEVIIECMKMHESNLKVQKQASWAVRNMVSRSRHQNQHFLSLGVEELLIKAMEKFKLECEYDFKAALRDLGCNVQLKEEWTGKGGKIYTSEKKTEE